MKYSVNLKFIAVPILFLASTCSAQSLSFKDLEGKWIDPNKNDSTSFFYFLSYMTVIISIENQKKVCGYKLDSLNNEETILISLAPEDTFYVLRNFIRRINNDKIALQSYEDPKTAKWQNETKLNTVYFVRNK